MANEGPTTVGSIVAKADLNLDEYDRKATEAKATAAELGAMRPTVTLDVKNGAEAVAEITAAKVAVEALDESAGALVPDLDKAGASTKGLGDESDTTSRKSGTFKAVWDALRQSMKQTDDENQQSIPRWQMYVGLFAALTPLVAPLGGYLVGVGGALAGMGAAGILAIVGITQAIKEGTAVGLTYQDGLQSLSSVLQSLGATAANAMLGAFQQVVTQINDALPMLNQQIAFFSSALGAIGNTVLSGVINGLRILNPLFITGTQYVQQLAQGFLSWTQNGGLQKFEQMAMNTFPQVVQTLGTLVSVAMNLVGALAPVGTVMLGILDVAGNLANFLITTLGPAFAPTVAGALAAYGAFQLWAAIAPMIEAITTAMGLLGVATSVAEGPIGWIAAGVGALAAVFLTVSASQHQASASLTDYTTALQADTGAIGDNVKAAAAKALVDSGAAAAYRALGGNVADLTGRLTGNADATKRVNDVLAQANATLEAGGVVALSYTNGFDSITAQQSQMVSNVKTVNGAIDEQSGAIQGALDQTSLLDAMDGSLNSTLDSGVQVTLSAADAYVKASQNVDGLSSKLDQLVNAVNKANGVGQDAISANNSYQQALQKVDDQITKANQGLQGYSLGLDANTATGAANLQMLSQMAQTSQDAALKQLQLDGNTANYKATLDAGRAAIIDRAQQLGLNADEAQNLANQIYGIPSDKNINIIANTAAASSQISDFVDRWNGVDINMNLFLDTSGGNVAAAASAARYTGQALAYEESQGYGSNGGTAPGLASGGTGGGTVRGPGSAASDQAGLYHLADGEEVISNKQGQADRYRGVLKMMNANVDPSIIQKGVMRVGGRSASTPVATAPSVSSSATATQPVTEVINLQVDGKTLATVIRKYDRALAGTASTK